MLEARPGTEDELADAFDVEVPAALDDMPLYLWHALRFDTLTFGCSPSSMPEPARRPTSASA